MTLRAAFTFVLGLLALSACKPASGPEVGGQTNWLVACESSAQCAGLACICGACTASCESDAACADLNGASCVAGTEEGVVALCGGAAESGVCLPRCEASCAEGTSCVAGVCVPPGSPAPRMTIDTSVRGQTLMGIGASLAYADDAIAAHPDKLALYDLVFGEAGLDALRLRNRYDDGSAAPLAAAQEIIAAASERLGRRPFVFMTSGSPPAALKANGTRTCGGDEASCTLASLPEGGFDYAGFARFWRDSLDAYARAGITPDYVSIQNNPNWVPPALARNEACKFLPAEGTAEVQVDGAPVEVSYPGYREALIAVRDALAGWPDAPRLAAPEGSGLRAVSEYVPALDAAMIDALALHLYGQDARAVDLAALEGARALAAQLDRPLLQTEMQADGLGTALLMHHAFTSGGATAYLQNDLVALTSGAADIALVLLTSDGLEPQGPYYALMHFAKHTDAGWTRVGAITEGGALLGSAFMAPDESALTVVLINPSDEDLEVELALGEQRFARSAITRTVFDEDERFAALGALSADGVVQLPPRSIATVALTRE